MPLWWLHLWKTAKKSCNSAPFSTPLVHCFSTSFMINAMSADQKFSSNKKWNTQATAGEKCPSLLVCCSALCDYVCRKWGLLVTLKEPLSPSCKVKRVLDWLLWWHCSSPVLSPSATSSRPHIAFKQQRQTGGIKEKGMTITWFFQVSCLWLKTSSGTLCCRKLLPFETKIFDWLKSKLQWRNNCTAKNKRHSVAENEKSHLHNKH